MKINIHLLDGELANLRVSGTPFRPELGGQQVSIDDDVYTYVTAESARRIAAAWSEVADELARREAAAEESAA